ncbi:MAG: RagB/SusD family nutrient uptake outer membrane protein [Cytophagaceae bacterium]|jgi:hypothetical protein|nr:RagB/SusD family nutrient uptake outer membrane protein [Cytophagaceae bacterium]
MKIILRIVAFSFALVYLAGCSDFLDKDVLGYSTEENFFDTQYKLQTALNGVYDVLQSDMFNQCDWRFGEATADDVWGNDEGMGRSMGELVQFRFKTSNEWIRNRYEINYEGVHRANQVIANAHKVKLAIYDEPSIRGIREILGQAKFLRALFYFNLVKTYGGVPIRPETETMSKLIVPRSTAAEVYAYIEKDLREAAVMLPAIFTDANAGKAGEGAAVALLMKVLMYQATPGERSEKWEEMMRLGEFFVDGKPMNYGEILKFNTYQEEWNDFRLRLWLDHKEWKAEEKEKSSLTTTLRELSTTYSLAYVSVNNRQLNDYGATNAYVAQFYLPGEFCRGSIFEITFNESKDGTGGDLNEGDAIYTALFPNNDIYGAKPMYTREDIVSSLFRGDPRVLTIQAHMAILPDGEMAQLVPGLLFPLKWYTPLKEMPQYGGDNGKNRRLIRFAEVILMYAEALNECGEGARAMEQVNKNRAQANTINGSGTLYVAGGYGYQRDQIWQERRAELAFEWDRFFDLVRQKRAAEVIKAFGLARDNKRGFYFRKGVNEIFPIPQTEIDISNGVIKQNPGY